MRAMWLIRPPGKKEDGKSLRHLKTSWKKAQDSAKPERAAETRKKGTNHIHVSAGSVMNPDQCQCSAVISASFLFRGITVRPNASLNCSVLAASPADCCLRRVCGNKHTRQQGAKCAAKKRIPYGTYGPELQLDTVNEGCSQQEVLIMDLQLQMSFYFGKPKDGSRVLLRICPHIINKVSQTPAVSLQAECHLYLLHTHVCFSSCPTALTCIL